jgi:hypothetical protein
VLLPHGIVYDGGQAWTGKHDVRLRHEALPQLSTRATRLTFDSDYETVLAVKARRDGLGAAIGEVAADSESTPAVEIGDWRRFTGNTIGSFVGLAPSDYSSVNRRLHRRWARFIDRRKKKPTIANTAIARELAGWSWSLAVLEK